MENKIDISKLLKNCPKGMELYSPLFGNCKFIKVHDYEAEIIVEIETGANVSFKTDGRYYDYPNAECILFPKGKTTWEGFVPPCKFKDGDILFVKSVYSWVLVYKESENNENLYKHIAIQNNHNHTYIVYDNNPLCCKEDVSEIRLATEEEKQKLFDVIKANGYKWNEETKALEKLIEPKFKVGDKIKHKENTRWVCTITMVTDRYHVDGHPMCFTLPFGKQNEYELVPNKFDITTLKPFDKVLVRVDNSYWRIQFFERINKKNKNYPFVCMNGSNYKQCIPYEGNEYLLSKTDDCDEYFKNWK